jgi:hypothetical protein
LSAAKAPATTVHDPIRHAITTLLRSATATSVVTVDRHRPLD